MEHFADRLISAVKRTGNAVLAGIDPRVDALPEALLRGGADDADAMRRFCSDVIALLADRVPAVKFQCAFFERLGPAGMSVLHDAAALAASKGLIVILDGKRNDIGSTAEAYADAYLSSGDPAVANPPWTGDAITINPYLGSDGIVPFTKVAARSGNGLFVLVRTSNPSAREFQDLVCDGRPIYRHVAERLSAWAAAHRGTSGYSLLGAVVGATYPEELAELRAALPGVLFLVPGYGAQGGSAADVAAAFDNDGFGAIVNNSRGLVFAFQNPTYRDRAKGDWQRAIELALEDMIADLAAHTPAGRLRSR